MKTNFFGILILVAGCRLAFGQSERYVTITAIPQLLGVTATNTYTISEAEAAEIISISGYPPYPSLYFQKDGTYFTSYHSADATAASRGSIVKGPATFVLIGPYPTPQYLTLKVMPEAYPPDKTLIIAPGTNQFQITLESSTNLVNWAAATNGVYGSPDEARFFRIHMQTFN